jgi:hypothetical protein
LKANCNRYCFYVEKFDPTKRKHHTKPKPNYTDEMEIMEDTLIHKDDKEFLARDN